MIGSPFGIHSGNGHRIFRTDDTHLLNLLVKLLIRYQISRFGIFQISRLLEFIPPFHQLRQRVFLLMHHRFCALHHRRKHRIHRPQHHRWEKHDAKSQDKGTEQGKHIDGFSPRNGRPNAQGNVKERTQTGNPLGNARHLRTERHHLIVGRAQ